MKTLFFFLLVISIAACSDKPENLAPRPGIYNNGNISTGNISNSGVAAPAGYTWSENQHNTGSAITNSASGFACYYNSSGKYKLTDNFVIPDGQTWDISSISVYISKDRYAGNVCPADNLRLMIWDGHPRLTTSRLVFGDSTTNVLSFTTDSLCYAIQNSTVPTPGISPVAHTKIWKLTSNVTKSLGAGNYWLVWQVQVPDPAGNQIYSPPVKIKGSRGMAGWNASVFNSLKIWQDIVDTGSPATIPYLPQDLPFEINYMY